MFSDISIIGSRNGRVVVIKSSNQISLCLSNIKFTTTTVDLIHYIGQTQRNLITRLNDHNPAISTSNDTDVTKHLWQNPDHHIDFNNPIALSHASNWRKLLIKETLLLLLLLLLGSGARESATVR